MREHYLRPLTPQGENPLVGCTIQPRRNPGTDAMSLLRKCDAARVRLRRQPKPPDPASLKLPPLNPTQKKVSNNDLQ